MDTKWGQLGINALAKDYVEDDGLQIIDVHPTRVRRRKCSIQFLSLVVVQIMKQICMRMLNNIMLILKQ